MAARRGRARRADRGRQHLRAGSRGRQRRLRRPAQRRRRRAARRLAACTGRASARAAVAAPGGRAHARRWWPGRSWTRPTITCSWGKGAQDFARQLGFTIEDDLNTRELAQAVAGVEAAHRPRATTSTPRSARGVGAQVTPRDDGARACIDPQHVYGTINCNGVNAKGEICGVTTTSGLAWKIPGRVGDSPILGAGLYVDGEVGRRGLHRAAARRTSTTSPRYLIVEEMRRGRHPKDAGMEALQAHPAPTPSRSGCSTPGAARTST